MTVPTRLLLVFTATLLVSATALAHAPGLSRATLREGPRELTVALRFDAADWRSLEARAGAGVRLESAGRPLSPLGPARVTRDGEHVDVVLAFPTAPSRLRFAFEGFGVLGHGHRHYVELRDRDGARITDAVLQESAPAVWLD